jgi:hypothetical protein
MNIQFLNDIRHIILRDVNILIDEVEQCEESKLWDNLPGVTNSVATLALHLCGNLRHFIGSVLARDGYIRDREQEFARTRQSKKEIIHTIRITLLVIEHAFDQIRPEELQEEMPETPPQHQGRSKAFFLMQLSCHLSRHTGQMNYLRRMVNADDE